VAVLSGPSGRLAVRLGYGPVLVAGGLTFGAGLLFFITTAGVDAHYVTHWLPGTLLVGVGVALSFPVLSAAAVAGLPQERFGIGGAINQTARQIGAVLGVAILIAVIGTPASLDQALTRFRVAWLIGAVAAVGSAAVSSFHRRPALERAPAGAVVLASADAA
jgi:MFS family permease